MAGENKMSGGMVWLFALGAIVLAELGGYLTAGMGSKISAGVFFGVFAVCGFLGMFLTRAKTGIGVLAFILASIGSAIVFYVMVTSLFAGAATEAANAAAAGQTETAVTEAAGATLGAAVGLFAGIIVLLGALVAGITGCVAGAKFRGKLASA